MTRGEMPELAEGARLEIVCTPKRCTEGSNPSLSAIFHFKFRIRESGIFFFELFSGSRLTFHPIPFTLYLILLCPILS